ncbi:MAG: RND family transporter [Mariniblastus sp.]
MIKRFYSLPLPFFGSVAMALLCTVFFLLPFALRGARLGLDDMQNNVADWLPEYYTETQELNEFRKYFYGGDQFVVVSGPWCKEGDPRYTNLKRKIFEESLEYEQVLKETQNDEELRAHREGDKLGLLYTGNYHEDFGEEREKWLKGKDATWYYITRKGDLFRWKGQNNVVEGGKRASERMFNGKNKVRGTFIGSFGAPPDDEKGIENVFYADPQKLCCRPFKSGISGPDVFQQMAGAEVDGEGRPGSLRIKGLGENDSTNVDAKIEAQKKLTGALFGPTPAKTFTWTFGSLLQHVDEATQTQLRSSDDYQGHFERYISSVVDEKYDGDVENLCSAPSSDQLEIWYQLWFQLDIPPPPRQTCIVVTLNDPVIHELSRAIGRPMLGKVRGRLLELATGECGIKAENFRVGGPPADNVAIDEEGTATLLRLVSLSLIIGLSLAYLSFGSIRVAAMLFFVGGTAAISSLSYVWFAGQTMDAILMSMPSLVYVLGLSSAVHIVNYYRDACYEDGSDLAVEKAVQHSWFPCSLAAFTTALGLFSLTISSLVPIWKFGLFSGIATIATVVLLFTYLPSALYVWKPGYEKRTKEELEQESGLSAAVGRFWSRIGDWVIDHYTIVTVGSVGLLIFFAIGVTKIETSVQLLKLFDPSAKILHDYRWLEENVGELVPAEIGLGIDLDAQQEAFREKYEQLELAKYPEGTTLEEALENATFQQDPEYKMAHDLKYSMLERVELSRRVRQQLERYFGPEGMGIVGSGMSMDVFTPLYRYEEQVKSTKRKAFSSALYQKKQELLGHGYYAIAGVSNLDQLQRERDAKDPEKAGSEMWRVSIRLAALNNVDYGQFVNDLKSVVEPVLNAYRVRTTILQNLQNDLGVESLNNCSVLILGRNPDSNKDNVKELVEKGGSMSEVINQTYIFSNTLQDLLENRGIARRVRKGQKKFYDWRDPDKIRDDFPPAEKFAEFVSKFDCVVVIEDDPLFDMDLISANAKQFVDCREHVFSIDEATKLPVAGMMTAKEMKKDEDLADGIDITAMYTGIVPIIYKTQRSLLQSLIESIGLAFVMISVVMMLLLRDWKSRWGANNFLNIRGGMISMLPNVFPVVIVFGFMGHMNKWFDGQIDYFLVDIGSMMTASVAMGVAVDDTIHFLNWYRYALEKGLRRKEAIKMAYSRVATAMTQTTLIGGLGLSAFALSTFTPTQRFGILMLILLGTALIGDLILLPALLAGPFGKYFGKERPIEEVEAERKLQAEQSLQGELAIQLDEPSLRLIGEIGEQAKASIPEVILPPGKDLSKNLRRLE